MGQFIHENQPFTNAPYIHAKIDLTLVAIATAVNITVI